MQPGVISEGCSSVYSAHPPHRPSPAPHRVGQGTQISYAGILLAVLIGVLHAALAPVITVAGVHPNLALVATVLLTDLGGFGVGVIFAFVAGLTANLLVREPLGSIPLALLLVVAGVAGSARILGRVTWAFPVVAVLVASILVDLLSLGILRLVDLPLSGGLPAERLLAAALLNAGLAAVLVAPVRLIAQRNAPDEKPAW
ncbi:MAG TPA: rod shape-determining protein MreD [Candidatus Limnocylindria bacterium]|nr:rod shape-determining protein MreD [Candidatus Limnocylindria bacterium]